MDERNEWLASYLGEKKTLIDRAESHPSSAIQAEGEHNAEKAAINGALKYRPRKDIEELVCSRFQQEEGEVMSRDRCTTTHIYIYYIHPELSLMNHCLHSGKGTRSLQRE